MHRTGAGVGPVNAMEVVHAFGAGPAGLRAFRDWLTAPDEELVELARRGGGAGSGGGGGSGSPGSAGTGGRGRGRGGGGGGKAGRRGGRRRQQAGDEDDAEEEQEEGLGSPGDGRHAEERGGEGDEGADAAAARLAAFKRQHRGARRAWEPPPSFPSEAVEQAYARPRVDPDKSR